MFTVIIHDFDTDFFVGSKEFDSLSDAQSWAHSQLSEYHATALIHDESDTEIDVITHTAGP